MLNSVNFIKQNAARFTCMTLVCGSALLSGCAGAQITNASAMNPPVAAQSDLQTRTQAGLQTTARPDTIQIIYKPAGGAARLVQSFTANADSGRMPGVAETARVSAAAGSIATTAAAGAGLHGVSETKRAGVSANAKRLAGAVAKQIAQIGVANGWISAEQTKG